MLEARCSGKLGMRAVLPGLLVYVSCIFCQTAVGVWSQSDTALPSAPVTDWLVQDRQRLLSWLRTVRVYIYDLNAEGFQSHFSAFDAAGPFCGDACQAQFEAPIWGADLCNQGYGQPVKEEQTKASLGAMLRRSGLTQTLCIASGEPCRIAQVLL